MSMKKSKLLSFMICLLFIISQISFADITDNDGSAFITKAEFDALKSSFQAQIDTYNQSIDSKIDTAIASYLSGIKITTEEQIDKLPYWTWSFPIGRLYKDEVNNMKHRNQSCPAITSERDTVCSTGYNQNASGLATSHTNAKKVDNYATLLSVTVSTYTLGKDKMLTHDDIVAEKQLFSKWGGQDGDVFLLKKVGTKWKVDDFLYGREELKYRSPLGEDSWKNPIGLTGFSWTNGDPTKDPAWYTESAYKYNMPGINGSTANEKLGSSVKNPSRIYCNYYISPVYVDPSTIVFDQAKTLQNNVKAAIDAAVIAAGKSTSEITSNSQDCTSNHLDSYQWITDNTNRHFIYTKDAYANATVDGNTAYKYVVSRADTEVTAETQDDESYHRTGHVFMVVCGSKGTAFNDPDQTIATAYYQDRPVVEYAITVPWRGVTYTNDTTAFSVKKASEIVYDIGGKEHNLAEGLYVYSAKSDGKFTCKIKFTDHENPTDTSKKVKLKMAKKGFNNTLTSSDSFSIKAEDATTHVLVTGTNPELKTNTIYNITIDGVKTNNDIYLMWDPSVATDDIELASMTEMIYTTEQ